jgi:hypothetical protein
MKGREYHGPKPSSYDERMAIAADYFKHSNEGMLYMESWKLGFYDGAFK